MAWLNNLLNSISRWSGNVFGFKAVLTLVGPVIMPAVWKLLWGSGFWGEQLDRVTSFGQVSIQNDVADGSIMLVVGLLAYMYRQVMHP